MYQIALTSICALLTFVTGGPRKNQNHHIQNSTYTLASASVKTDDYKPFWGLSQVDTTRNKHELQPAPQGQTAEKVINRYLNAIGGREKLEKVQDLSEIMTMQVDGYELKIHLKKKLPQRMDQKITIPSLRKTINQITVNNDSVKEVNNKKLQHLSNKDKNLFRYKASAIFEELKFSNPGYAIKLLGVRKMKANRVYVIQIFMPDSYRITDSFSIKNYYSAKTGLKLGSKRIKENKVHATRLSQYREVQGIMIPFSKKIITPSRTTTLKMKKVELNSGLKDADFI